MSGVIRPITINVKQGDVKYICNELCTNNIYTCRFRLIYIGNNSKLKKYMESVLKISNHVLADVTMEFDKTSTRINQQVYNDENGDEQMFVRLGFNGELKSFNNYITGKSIDRKFPNLNLDNYKGICYIFFLLCVKKAYHLGYATDDSQILASVYPDIIGKDKTLSWNKIIKYYKKIGFELLYPEYLDSVIQGNQDDECVPIIIKVKDINYFLDDCISTHYLPNLLYDMLSENL